MDVEKIHFDKFEDSDKISLAYGYVGHDRATYAIHPKVADKIGAELMVHEFNEVAILFALRKIDELKYRKLATLSHNLNAEGDGEYDGEPNLLHEYVQSDRTPIIDKVFTSKEIDELRDLAHSK